MIRSISLLFLSLFTVQSFANTILVLGDSLSAGYQMSIEQSWPSLLPDALDKQSISANVVNGSISGDTTGNGLARLPSLLAQHKPDWVLIELGANDGLRGFPPKLITNNLKIIIESSIESGANVTLMQIEVPPNYGKRYTSAFSDIYPALAEEYDIPLLPFFLEEVIIKPEWMMDDGLHPKPIAQPWIANYVADNLAQHLNK
jgi:acyl-CoA thioesterase-1